MKIIARFGVFILVILTMTISSCQQDPSGAYTDCTHHMISARGEFLTSCGMVVNHGADLAKVELDFNLTSGTINWLLKDPYDNIQLEGVVDSTEELIEEHTIHEPVPGTWIFEFYLQDAEGEYYSNWQVQSFQRGS